MSRRVPLSETMQDLMSYPEIAEDLARAQRDLGTVTHPKTGQVYQFKRAKSYYQWKREQREYRAAQFKQRRLDELERAEFKMLFPSRWTRFWNWLLRRGPA